MDYFEKQQSLTKSNLNKDPEITFDPGKLVLKSSIAEKLVTDQHKHGYKEVRTMISDALDDYYMGWDGK